MKVRRELLNMSLTTATRYGLNALTLFGLSIALYVGRSMMVPLTIAVVLAAILWPSAKQLNQKYRLPWFFACATTVSVMVLFGLLIFVGFAASLPGLMSELLPKPVEGGKEAYYLKIREQVARSAPFAIDKTFPVDPNDSSFYQYLSKTFDGNYVTDAMLDITKQAGMILLQGLLVIFMLFFLLLEGEILAKKVRNIFGTGPDTQKRVTTALAEMAVAVRTYMIWRTIVNVGLAIFLGALYSALGLKQWAFWSLLTVILCYVPYLGTIAAGIPPVLDAFLNVGPITALWIVIFYTAVVTIEGYIIVPWVMGRSMDLNATTVLLSCLYWDYVWGTPGLFLAMPLMAAVKAVCLQVDGWRPWGLLMGYADDPTPPPSVPDLPDMVEIDSVADTDFFARHPEVPVAPRGETSSPATPPVAPQ